MRAIIITDTEAKALIDSLKLEALEKSNNMRAGSAECEVTQQLHRAFHYTVTRWLQAVGADTLKG